MADRVLAVLNAGSTINAVARDEAEDRYLVRSELFEFLSIVAKRAFEENQENVDLAELEKIVQVALLPDTAVNADTVLHYMHPMREENGFTAEIRLREVDRTDLRVVRNTLNAAATLQRVQRIGDSTDQFYIHRDLYRTLARIRASSLAGHRLGQFAGSRPRDGGFLRGEAPALEGHDARPRLAHTPSDGLVPALDAANHDDPQEADEEKRNQKLWRLLGPLTSKPDAYLVTTSEALAAANAAKDALSKLRQSRPAIDRYVTEREERAQTDLDGSVREALDAAETEDYRKAIKDACDEIDRNWGVVMLLPDGIVEQALNDLIGDLEPESGAGQLASEHQQLLQSVKRLLNAMESSSRMRGGSWRRVEAALVEASGEGSHELPYSRSAMTTSKRTLN